MTDHPHIITILPDIADNRAEWEVKPHQPSTISAAVARLCILSLAEMYLAIFDKLLSHPFDMYYAAACVSPAYIAVQ